MPDRLDPLPAVPGLRWADGLLYPALQPTNRDVPSDIPFCIRPGPMLPACSCRRGRIRWALREPPPEPGVIPSA